MGEDNCNSAGTTDVLGAWIIFYLRDILSIIGDEAEFPCPLPHTHFLDQLLAVTTRDFYGHVKHSQRSGGDD